MFAELQQSFSCYSPHIFVAGRKIMYSIPNMLNKGAELLHNKSGQREDVGDEDEDAELRPSLS